MAPTIDVIRHAQAWHNASQDSYISDPLLTPEGEVQSYQFRDTYPFMAQVSHVVASPLRRAVATALIAFDPAVRSGKKAILLPDLQETGAMPSDTGSPPRRLEAMFKPHVDLSHLSERWYRRDESSDYAPDVAKVEARARRARRFLRDLARGAPDDAHIAVVTHGGFLHFLTDDYAGLGPGCFSSFGNTDMKSYQFADLHGDNDEAALVRVSWDRELRPVHGLAAASEEERRALKIFAVDRVRLQGMKERKKQLRRRREEAVGRGAREVAGIVEAAFLSSYAEFLATWSHRGAI
ncbi:phosphoglycerate mutase-like protein [Biscogniauxia marginata]|nr:phosphoglycerate mutase-like protein [Biscogniauxia marginata]